MPSENPIQRLRDISESIDAIQTFTAGMSFDEFAADIKTSPDFILSSCQTAAGNGRGRPLLRHHA
jgi:uncharacterized protein with HEPN domain